MTATTATVPAVTTRLCGELAGAMWQARSEGRPTVNLWLEVEETLAIASDDVAVDAIVRRFPDDVDHAVAELLRQGRENAARLRR